MTLLWYEWKAMRNRTHSRERDSAYLDDDSPGRATQFNLALLLHSHVPEIWTIEMHLETRGRPCQHSSHCLAPLIAGRKLGQVSDPSSLNACFP